MSFCFVVFKVIRMRIGQPTVSDLKVIAWFICVGDELVIVLLVVVVSADTAHLVEVFVGNLDSHLVVISERNSYPKVCKQFL